MLFFTNRVISTSKKSFDFLSNLTQFYHKKNSKMGKICVVDASNLLWFIWFFFVILSQWSQHMTLSVVFWGKFISGSTLHAVNVLIVLIPWVKLWYLLLACIVIILGQKKHHSPKSWRQKYQPQNNLFGQCKQAYYCFYSFWFRVSLITSI